MASEQAAERRTLICPSCGHDNPADAQFCARCGSSLPQPSPPSGMPPVERRPVERAPVIRPEAVVSYSEGGTRFFDRVGSRSIAAVLVALSSLAILGWLGAQVVYSVDQTQFVVITRFGEITEVHASPGLNFKMPFIDTVHRLDNRVLRVDLPPPSMPDVDNQFLEMDAFVRYQITDPVKFIQTLRNEVSAASTIGQIVIAALRNEVGLSTQAEITGERLTGIEQQDPIVELLLTADGRPASQAIVEAARAKIDALVHAPENDFGIEIMDVQAIMRGASDN